LLADSRPTLSDSRLCGRFRCTGYPLSAREPGSGTIFTGGKRDHGTLATHSAQRYLAPEADCRLDGQGQVQDGRGGGMDASRGRLDGKAELVAVDDP
jgi:hypothetical protein